MRHNTLCLQILDRTGSFLKFWRYSLQNKQKRYKYGKEKSLCIHVWRVKYRWKLVAMYNMLTISYINYVRLKGSFKAIQIVRSDLNRPYSRYRPSLHELKVRKNGQQKHCCKTSWIAMLSFCIPFLWCPTVLQGGHLELVSVVFQSRRRQLFHFWPRLVLLKLLC